MLTSFDPGTGMLTARACQGTGLNGGSCLDNHCDTLWEGSVVGDQASLTLVNHTSPCGIGDPGQNRLYGCEVTASLSAVARSRSARLPRGGEPEPTQDLVLVGEGDGDFFGCLGGTQTTSFELSTPDFSGVSSD